MRDNSILVKGAEKIGIVLSEKQQQQFETYYDYLVSQNEVMNLTAITEYEEVLTKHFLDSLFLAKTMKDFDGKKVIDLGTGAGFPGLPLKIFDESLDVTLMDSLNKRINFLNEVIDALELDGIETVHSRAEDLGKNKDYREKYDICISRAVANLATLSELCLPFVKVGGYFISMKGPKAEEELSCAKKAIKLLGGEFEEIKNYAIDETDFDHNLVIIRKVSSTPSKYPRNAPKPAKEPLV